MKRKAVCFVLTLLAIALFSLGCGGGGGSSNPAASNIVGSARVSGVVTDSKNNPVSNAKVRLALASNALVNSITGTQQKSLRLSTSGVQTEFATTTDNYGKYTFNNVPFGEYTLSAVTADGGQIVTNLKVTAAGDLNVNDIKIMPFGKISGKVTLSGANVRGAIVYINGASYCSVTDSNGAYSIDGVPVNTDFVLCAMLSGCDTVTQSVKITASESLELTAEEFKLSPTSSKFASRSFTIIGSGASLSNLFVFAVNKEDGTTFASVVDNSSSKISITKLGTYNVFVASFANGMNFAGTLKEVDITSFDSPEEAIELSIGAPNSSSSNYASISGNVVAEDNSKDTSFEVAIYDSTGHEHKQTVSANSTFMFKNLPADTYSLAVYSESTLKVQTGIELSNVDKSLGDIKPVVIENVTFDTLNGIATITINLSSSLVTNESDDLFFSVLSEKESGTIELFDDKIENTSFKVTTSKIEQGLSLDNLNSSDEINAVKFSFKNGLDKNVFEKVFRLSHSMPMQTNSYKNVQLTSTTPINNYSGVINPKDSDIVLFKTLAYDGKIFYLVVTDKAAYVFNADGSEKAAVDFSQKFENFSNSKITYGNAAFLENGTDVVLAVQYIYSLNVENTKLYLYKYSFNTLLSNGTPTRLYPVSDTESFNKKFAYKLLLSSDGKITSICDNYIYEYNPSTSLWGSKSIEAYEGSLVIAPTVIKSDSSTSIHYLAEDREFNNWLLGINCEYDESCGTYRAYKRINLGQSEKYSLSDCLDSEYAENKLYIWENYNKNNLNSNPKYVYSDSIYSGANIKSSYSKSGNYEAWIERNSEGQYLKLRNTNTFREQKIKVSQVLNTSSFLEGSICFTTVNGDQIHVLRINESTNCLNVMVLNCIESNN